MLELCLGLVLNKLNGGDRKHNARCRWPVDEKVRLIEVSMAPGSSISLVARTYDVAPTLLYRWRKQMSEGSKTIFC